MKQVKVEFTGKNLTGQAGFIHMERFIRKLGLHSLLKRHISIERGNNARYSVADVVTMLAMGALAGVKHMSHMAVLRADQVIRRLFDWEAFPDDRTLGRIFEEFIPNLTTAIRDMYLYQQVTTNLYTQKAIEV